MRMGKADQRTYLRYGKEIKGDSLAIVIKNKTEMITYLSVTMIRTTTTFKEEFVLMVIVSPNIVVKAVNASAWFESSKAIMAESFATGSDHQVVNELNGERLRAKRSFKRLGRAIRYNFQVDDAKFRRDNVKEIISTLVDNEVDLSQNKYDHFKEIEDKVEKGFKIAKATSK